MIYLSGVINDPWRVAMNTYPKLGLMAQPRCAMVKDTPGRLWAADNGAYGWWMAGKQFDFIAWERYLMRLPNPETPLFATCPDVVADHNGTLTQWNRWADKIRASGGFEPAFALQNGCTNLRRQVPSDAQILFIGGDTEYKIGNATARLVDQAKSDGRWVHMGRVNSAKRLCRAVAMGCDSADGTFLKHGPPQVMVDRLLGFLHAARTGHRSSQRDVWDLAGVA